MAEPAGIDFSGSIGNIPSVIDSLNAAFNDLVKGVQNLSLQTLKLNETTQTIGATWKGTTNDGKSFTATLKDVDDGVGKLNLTFNESLKAQEKFNQNLRATNLRTDFAPQVSIPQQLPSFDTTRIENSIERVIQVAARAKISSADLQSAFELLKESGTRSIDGLDINTNAALNRLISQLDRAKEKADSIAKKQLIGE